MPSTSSASRLWPVAVALLAVVISSFALATRAVANPASVLYAYVANAADGSVSAISTAGRPVEAWRLDIGERAAHGIATSPDGRFVYAGDATNKEVVVIDTAARSVVARISLGTSIHGLDISPDGNTLWVGGQVDDDPVRGALTVIDTASRQVTDVISPALGSASHAAFTPDGSEVWVASTSTNLVWVVDVAAKRVAAAVPLSLPEAEQRPAPEDDWSEYLEERGLIGLNQVAISPDGRRAYAVGPATSELYAIDVATRQVLASVPAGERAHGLEVSPDGEEVWVSDWSGVVLVFDAASLAPLASIAVAGDLGAGERGANHVAFSPDGRRAYVSGTGEVIVLDAGTRRVLSRIAVGQEPHELAIAPPPSQPSANSAGDGSVAQQQERRPAGSSPERRDVKGAVTVVVTPLDFTTGTTLDFAISLETHAVELDYDLSEIAILRDDRGNEYEPERWTGGQGGHHLEGILSFGSRDRIMAGSPGSLTLELAGIARVPSRTFTWDLSGQTATLGEG